MTDGPWPDEYLAQLDQWLQQPGATYVDLAAHLNTTPDLVRGRVRRYRARQPMRANGFTVPDEPVAQGGAIVNGALDETGQFAQPVKSPSFGKRESDRITRFALIGDTHFGSKHCCAAELLDFYGWAYGLGVRDFYHTGDIVAGYHAKWRNELLAAGMDDQLDIAFDMLPQLDGVQTHFITGNHCDKYARDAGAAVGPHLVRRFTELGRSDVHFLGGNRAEVRAAPGALLGLQHPGGGGGENLGTTVYGYYRRHPSFGQLRFYACGHYHRDDHAHRNGADLFAVPAFEGSNVWGQGLRGSPDVGGLVVELDGKEFTLRRRLY